MLQKLKLLLRNIKIREKMILIYFFGGILPMLVVILYNNHATKDILIKQSMESEVAELSLIKDGIYEKIRMVSEMELEIECPIPNSHIYQFPALYWYG